MYKNTFTIIQWSSTSCQYMCLTKNLQTLSRMITTEYIPKTCYE